MRVLLSGGGTGGHINPALAIAQKIKEKDKDAVIEYVGTTKGLENTLVPKEGYKLHTVKVRGFVRKLSLKNIDAAIKAVTSVMEAKRIVKKFSPDIVIGTGGYVSWPVLKAASSLKVPTAIHEQNAIPGLTTKTLSKYADAVMISFAESEKYFDCKEKLTLVGNPINSKMLSCERTAARKEAGIDENDNSLLVLSYGGSLGAARINETVFDLISVFSKTGGIHHIHATGRGSFAEMSERYIKEGFKKEGEGTLVCGNVTVKEYIYNMHTLLCAADIVICRAGAMTLAELAALSKAAIIIPSPNVTNNHQYINASVLEKAGAAIVIEEKDLTSELLIKTVKELKDDKAKLNSLRENIKKFAILDSTDKIYSVISNLVKNKE